MWPMTIDLPVLFYSTPVLTVREATQHRCWGPFISPVFWINFSKTPLPLPRFMTSSLEFIRTILKTLKEALFVITATFLLYAKWKLLDSMCTKIYGKMCSMKLAMQCLSIPQRSWNITNNTIIRNTLILVCPAWKVHIRKFSLRFWNYGLNNLINMKIQFHSMVKSRNVLSFLRLSSSGFTRVFISPVKESSSRLKKKFVIRSLT